MRLYKTPILRTKPFINTIISALALIAMPAQAASYIVLNDSDSDADSLRDIISQVNADNVEDTITFDASLDGGLITLTTGQIDITDTEGLIIDASALTNGITISGNDASRIFGVTENQLLTLNNIHITEGKTTGDNSGAFDCADGAAYTRGGAICTEGALTLLQSTVSHSHTEGSSAWGGGGRVRYELVLENSLISNNGTLDGNGGGFRVESLDMMNSIVMNNTTVGAHSRGGGLFAYGDAMIINSLIVWNSTGGTGSDGGGIRTSNGTLTLNNSTISGNSILGGGAYGGGISAVSGNVILNNSTITGNSVSGGSSGGGLAMSTFNGDYTVTLNSTILADNGSNNYRTSIGGAGSFTVNADHSLFGDDVSELTGNTDNQLTNAPGLLALADNVCAVEAGAPGTQLCVKTHAIDVGSVALEHGSNPEGYTSDQRGLGFARVKSTQVDIGAFEHGVATAGDCTGEGAVDVLDVHCTTDIVLSGGAAVNGANADGDIDIDIHDVVKIIDIATP